MIVTFEMDEAFHLMIDWGEAVMLVKPTFLIGFA
jgi:hypothetical protein